MIKEITMHHVPLLIGFILAILTGCGAGPKAPAASAPKQEPTVVSSHVKCTTPNQAGCLDIQIGNLQNDPQNAVMASLGKSPTSLKERAERVENTGPSLLKAYKASEVKAAPNHTYLVYVWGGKKDVGLGNLASHNFDGKSFTKGTVEDVTATAPAPTFDSTVTSLGKPDKVYRMKATSGQTSFQAPWTMLEKATILVCAENNDSLSPGKNKGSLITEAYMTHMKAKGWVWAAMAFVYDPPGAVAKK